MGLTAISHPCTHFLLHLELNNFLYIELISFLHLDISLSLSYLEHWESEVEVGMIVFVLLKIVKLDFLIKSISSNVKGKIFNKQKTLIIYHKLSNNLILDNYTLKFV